MEPSAEPEPYKHVVFLPVERRHGQGTTPGILSCVQRCKAAQFIFSYSVPNSLAEVLPCGLNMCTSRPDFVICGAFASCSLQSMYIR